MIITEDGCVGCELPCLGSSCSYHTVRYFVCDVCGKESDELYENKLSGEQLCFDCVIEEYNIIN